MTELIADRSPTSTPAAGTRGGDDTRAARPVGPGSTPAAVLASGDEFDDPIPF
jgi:hypothetical protein